VPIEPIDIWVTLRSDAAPVDEDRGTRRARRLNDCTDAAQVSTYIKITLTDTYTPQWTSFGVGGPVNYSVVRMVQIS